MELMICQNCGSLLRPRRRDCADCGGLVSKHSPTNLIALKAGGPKEKCIPAPPNDHLLLERVVTFRTTDRLSETSPCRGKKSCNHGIDGKREDDAAGSVVASRSFTFGASLDGNVVSARAEASGDLKANHANGTAGSDTADGDIADLLERAERESAFRSQKKMGIPAGESIDSTGAATLDEGADYSVEGTESQNSDNSKSKRNKGTSGGKTSASNGKASSKEKGDRGSAKGLSAKMLGGSTEGSPQKPPLKMVLTAAAIGIFVIGAACFTFMKQSPAPQQAQMPVNSANFNFPTQPTDVSSLPSNPQLAGMMPPNISGNWKVQVEFQGTNGQPIVQEFIAAVSQNTASIAGRGADANGPFSIRGTVSVSRPYTLEFQKAYDASNSAVMPINFRGEVIDDPVRIAYGPCVMRIARGGGVLQRARSDMLEGSWSAERTTQSPAPASQFPQPSGTNVTAILGVLLAVGISVFMFMKQKGTVISRAEGVSRSKDSRKAAPDEPEEAESDDR
jgi:hypothetical protein